MGFSSNEVSIVNLNSNEAPFEINIHIQIRIISLILTKLAVLSPDFLFTLTGLI